MGIRENEKDVVMVILTSHFDGITCHNNCYYTSTLCTLYSLKCVLVFRTYRPLEASAHPHFGLSVEPISFEVGGTFSQSRH